MEIIVHLLQNTRITKEAYKSFGECFVIAKMLLIDTALYSYYCPKKVQVIIEIDITSKITNNQTDIQNTYKYKIHIQKIQAMTSIDKSKHKHQTHIQQANTGINTSL